MYETHICVRSIYTGASFTKVLFLSTKLVQWSIQSCNWSAFNYPVVRNYLLKSNATNTRLKHNSNGHWVHMGPHTSNGFGDNCVWSCVLKLVLLNLLLYIYPLPTTQPKKNEKRIKRVFDVSEAITICC